MTAHTVELANVPKNDKPWWKQRHLIRLNWHIISLVMFSSANGYDGSVMSGILALDTWNIGLQAGAPNEKTFTLSRLVIGLASGWLGNSSPLLVNEIAHPKQRSIANALYMCGCDWSWRIPVLLQALIPLLALPGFLMSPESPRWLISVGRVDEAADLLAKHHAGGNRDDPLVVYQLSEIETTITAEKEASSSASYADMVKTPGNRHRLFISVTLGFFAQWAGNGVVSYYLPLVLDSVGVKTVTEQTLISACLNVWNLGWAVAAAMNVDRLGRRFLFMSSGVTMLTSFIIVTGLSGAFASSASSSVGMAVIPFLFLFFAGYDIALTPFLTAYPCEIWQFSLRSRGLTVAWCTTVASIFLNTFVNAIALDAIGWKYYFVFIVVLSLMIITVFFGYPETRGYTLEQMAIVFDGVDAPVNSSNLMEKNAAVSHVADADQQGSAKHSKV
ncbi:sugar transporter [Verticillium alfalfae VaMs.102]|uniref:Sugar transporter n=1 Tax=Verticillium alfalfae (strain VaMs.102 / ATCC MYA-4576 / FGSC 10136) TaxID=526221 RepID=C9S7Q5_VERA1|nr:sugar transporter [Verticillium alfalfae VaMs.102]EEY15272.1 sugar transporter [Verticillium alfalfae VaMs.102]